MQEPVSPIQITLPVRQLVEFLRRAGSIDNRFTGFDRANEGARIHRKLQRAAVCKKHYILGLVKSLGRHFINHSLIIVRFTKLI